MIREKEPRLEYNNTELERVSIRHNRFWTERERETANKKELLRKAGDLEFFLAHTFTSRSNYCARFLPFSSETLASNTRIRRWEWRGEKKTEKKEDEDDDVDEKKESNNKTLALPEVLLRHDGVKSIMWTGFRFRRTHYLVLFMMVQSVSHRSDVVVRARLRQLEQYEHSERFEMSKVSAQFEILSAFFFRYTQRQEKKKEEEEESEKRIPAFLFGLSIMHVLSFCLLPRLMIGRRGAFVKCNKRNVRWSGEREKRRTTLAWNNKVRCERNGKEGRREAKKRFAPLWFWRTEKMMMKVNGSLPAVHVNIQGNQE